jgi:hypothetical protein
MQGTVCGLFMFSNLQLLKENRRLRSEVADLRSELAATRDAAAAATHELTPREQSPRAARECGLGPASEPVLRRPPAAAAPPTIGAGADPPATESASMLLRSAQAEGSSSFERERDGSPPAPPAGTAPAPPAHLLDLHAGSTPPPDRGAGVPHGAYAAAPAPLPGRHACTQSCPAFVRGDPDAGSSCSIVLGEPASDNALTAPGLSAGGTQHLLGSGHKSSSVTAAALPVIDEHGGGTPDAKVRGGSARQHGGGEAVPRMASLPRNAGPQRPPVRHGSMMGSSMGEDSFIDAVVASGARAAGAAGLPFWAMASPAPAAVEALGGRPPVLRAQTAPDLASVAQHVGASSQGSGSFLLHSTELLGSGALAQAGAALSLSQPGEDASLAGPGSQTTFMQAQLPSLAAMQPVCVPPQQPTPDVEHQRERPPVRLTNSAMRASGPPHGTFVFHPHRAPSPPPQVIAPPRNPFLATPAPAALGHLRTVRTPAYAGAHMAAREPWDALGPRPAVLQPQDLPRAHGWHAQPLPQAGLDVPARQVAPADFARLSRTGGGNEGHVLPQATGNPFAPMVAQEQLAPIGTCQSSNFAAGPQSSAGTWHHSVRSDSFLL